MKKRNVYWGIFFIAAAAFIVLHQLGFLVEVSLLSLIITLLMIPVFVHSARHLHFGGMLFPLAIGGILFSEQLGIEKFTPWPILGVALFLTIGLSMLFPRKHHWEHYESFSSTNSEIEPSESMDGSEININSKFNGCVKYITSKDLSKINVNSSFGGIKIYFDEADISGDTAVINLNSEFSGVDLYVPSCWNIINKASCSFGAVDEKGKRKNDVTTKNLIVTGRVSFAGVTVHYV